MASMQVSSSGLDYSPASTCRAARRADPRARGDGACTSDPIGACAVHRLFVRIQARCLVEEPDAPLGLVDPILDQACRRDITMLVTDRMCASQPHGQLRVVLAQLDQHVLRGNKLLLVVRNTLQLGDL